MLSRNFLTIFLFLFPWYGKAELLKDKGLIHFMRTQGLKNISFSESFEYVLSEWPETYFIVTQDKEKIRISPLESTLRQRYFSPYRWCFPGNFAEKQCLKLNSIRTILNNSILAIFKKLFQKLTVECTFKWFKPQVDGASMRDTLSVVLSDCFKSKLERAAFIPLK